MGIEPDLDFPTNSYRVEPPPEEPRPKNEPPPTAPAVGYSIVADLGRGRQMTMQCFVGEDESDEAINTKVDRVLRVMDRQKAKYEVRDLEKDFEKAALNVRNLMVAIPIAEMMAAKQTEELKAKLTGQQEGRKTLFDDGYNYHVASGRKGTYKPTGHVQSRLDAADREIKQTIDAIQAKPNDTEQERQKMLVNIQRYQQDMVERRREINETRRTAGLPDYDAFMEEETFVPPLKG